MKKKSKVYEIEFITEDKRMYTAEVEYMFSYDPSYGADADGRRGIGVWDCVGAEVIDVWDADGNTINESKLDFMATKALDKAIEEFDGFDNLDDC